MEYVDRTDLFQKYSEKWVAMTDDDQVICAGNSADEVLTEAQKKSFAEPIITKILNPNYDYLLP